MNYIAEMSQFIDLKRSSKVKRCRFSFRHYSDEFCRLLHCGFQLPCGNDDFISLRNINNNIYDFVTVKRKKRRQRSSKNRCGNAPLEPNVKLRAAKPNTPVYISRLHYTTEAADIVEYVRRKLNYTARVQLLESRRNVNLKAFVVRIPTCYLNLVLEESFWPLNVVFRRFRGPIPHDGTKSVQC